MKKNGFIATSLLYSFFLVFCALLLALVATYVHNRLLLNNLTNNVKDELSNINNRTATELKIGDYVKMSLFSNERSINISDKLWVVASIDANTINLVSATVLFATNKYADGTTMQNELDLYYNLYTTGGEENYSHVTYLTKTQLDNFHNETKEIIKNALLDYQNEYIYYDDKKASPKFYLRKSCVGCNEYDNTLIAPNQYPIRLSINISKNALILGGKGLYLDPYTFAYYALNDSLILHYDYLNISGNKGLKTSNTNLITDLSGNNTFGQSDINYTNDKTNGITLNGTLDTKLNIFESLKNEYTIEFKSYGNFNLSTSTISNFINSTLASGRVNLTIGGVLNTFNNITESYTISIVKNTNNNIIIYINSKKMDLISAYNAPTINLNDILYIGNVTNFKSLRIYNKALTLDEIRNNYNVDKRWCG
ncbi:MAG: hypothetical protein PHD03_00685 [Bacilli bacterium]|nr:hypothetical protein [Bacilli bacterium]MDD4406765.1 hypothetical protein [Bacilli bacterium]